MKRIFYKTLILLALLVPALAYGQSEGSAFDFGNISFALTPKVMEDGSITDISLGLVYNEILGGDYRYRSTIVSKNEEFPDLSDSLNARNEKTYEAFILPVGYRRKSDSTLFWAGIGAYYEYNILNEKGFFDDPELETGGFERVNSYTNDFSMHVIGPLIDLKFDYVHEYFNISLYGGIVPVFFLAADEEFGIIPFLGEAKAKHSQTTWGSPYFYVGLDAVIYKYVNLGVHYTFSKLTYEMVDYNFNDSGKVVWDYPETTVIGHSLQLEASVLVPLGKEMRFQIGYGYNINTIVLDSGDIEDNKHYLILGAKKYAR